MSDTDAAIAAPDEDAADPVLQSAVWLVQELGFSMPPVPELYAGTLREVSLGKLFATDPALLALDSRAALTAALRTAWPASGLAFGYKGYGRGGVWFYTLVGGRQIIHLSMVLSYDPAAPRYAAIAAVDEAHHRLDAYLTVDSHYGRSVLAMPQSDADSRRVIVFSAADGETPFEFQAAWTPGAEPLGPFGVRAEIFSDVPPMPEPSHEVIFRV